MVAVGRHNKARGYHTGTDGAIPLKTTSKNIEELNAPGMYSMKFMLKMEGSIVKGLQLVLLMYLAATQISRGRGRRAFRKS